MAAQADNHGTHVSGTIGGAQNGAGVVGVSWKVKLISAKFLGPRGGTVAGAALALNYIVSLKTKKGLNIVATSNSWEGGDFSQTLRDAIARCGAANILFVAAAGNGRWPSAASLARCRGRLHWPAAAPRRGSPSLGSCSAGECAEPGTHAGRAEIQLRPPIARLVPRSMRR